MNTTGCRLSPWRYQFGTPKNLDCSGSGETMCCIQKRGNFNLKMFKEDQQLPQRRQIVVILVQKNCKWINEWHPNTPPNAANVGRLAQSSSVETLSILERDRLNQPKLFQVESLNTVFGGTLNAGVDLRHCQSTWWCEVFKRPSSATHAHRKAG